MQNTNISGYLARVLIVLLVAGTAVAPVLGEESDPGVAALDGDSAVVISTSADPVAAEDLIPPYPPGWEPPESPATRDSGGLYPTTAFDPTSNTLFLYPGWNFVSTPLWLAEGHDTIAIFDEVETAGHSVLSYDGSSGLWDALSSSEDFDPLDAIWIYATEPYQIHLYFKPAQEQTAATKHLYEGWNAVGFWDVNQVCARDTLLSLGSAWSIAYGFDAGTQEYEVSMISGATGRHSDQRLMFPGKGYWVNAAAEGTLIPLKATKDNHDEDYPQVGVEWVENYDLDWQHPLSQCSNTSRGFYNTLVEEGGWIPMFEYGDHEVQRDHFCVNGSDQQYIDGVDVALFTGHCCNQWLVLSGVLETVPYIDCNWGDYDLEWLFLHGCHTTENPDIFKMPVPYRTMNGVHLICGYVTAAWDTDDGATLATYLLEGKTVKEAWFSAIDETHNANFTLRVIGENEACGSDHIWGSGTVVPDQPVDATYYEWIYNCRDD